jgi:CspA family cold shock protein
VREALKRFGGAGVVAETAALNQVACGNRNRKGHMPEGTVKWFNKKKNYGFIVYEDQEEVFFHGSNISDHGFFGLRQDDRVSFELRDTRNGPQAFKVKVLS